MSIEEPTSARLHLYLAGPLFSDAEREFNRKLRRLLSPYFELYVPQEDGGLFVDMLESGTSPSDAGRRIFTWDIAALDRCDLVLVVLDGRTIDEGAAFELGYAYAVSKLCYGVQTDPRRLVPSGNNPMIEQALAYVFHSVDELVAWAAKSSMIRIQT